MRGLGGVDPRVDVECCLVSPELEDHQLVGVQSTLKNLKLLAAGLLLHGAAAVGHGPGELGALAGFGVRGNEGSE